MLSLEVNLEELKNKNFDEILELANAMCDEIIKFETVTKAEIIKLMAEKLIEAGYPAIDCAGLILERMKHRVTRQYVSSCLDERFKRSTKIAAGKATRAKEAAKVLAQSAGGGGSSGQALVDPEQEQGGDSEDNDGDDGDLKGRAELREQLKDIHPQLESDPEINVPIALYIKELEAKVKDLEAKNNFLTQLIRKRNEELPYHDNLLYYRVNKLDKPRVHELVDASASSKTNIVMITDIRNSNVVKIYTDKEWKKQTVYPTKTSDLSETEME